MNKDKMFSSEERGEDCNKRLGKRPESLQFTVDFLLLVV